MRDAIMKQLEAFKLWAAVLGLTTLESLIDKLLATSGLLDWALELLEKFLTRAQAAGTAYAFDAKSLSVKETEFAQANGIDIGKMIQLIQLFIQFWNQVSPILKSVEHQA